MEIQVENSVDIEPVTDVEVAASNVAEVSVADDTALDVSVVKKEYKIVGDEVYIAKLYEDAPQWMKDLVQLVVDNTMASESTALLNSLVSQLNQFAVSYVPLNTYTQSILDLSNADTAMHNTIETLNSNFNDGLNEANSQIIDLQSTKASKTEVATKVVETLAAQLALPTSDIGATIANMQQAIVNGDSANADSITTLTSVLEGEVDARATAVSALDTRVTATETAITAQASDITALTTEVNNGTNTWAAADSNLENSLTTAITNGLTTAESKFAYNSNLNINGTSYSSGFGLATSLVDASIPVGSSEFWVKSDKFRLVAANSDIKSAYSPFSVDAATGNILMNGNVRFLNTTGGTGTLQDVVQGYVETVQVGDKNINITDNLIPMVSLIADTNNAGYQFIGTPMKSNAIGISAYAEPQIQIDVGDEVYSPYVTELALAYYYRFGITGVTSLSGVKLITIDAANTVTYTDLVVTLDPGQSLQSNQWYVVEGLTNPTGSSGGSDGSIRTANGTKIGTVNVYVLPTGATKLLLGWVGPCTISRGKLAKVSADTVTGDVASIDYVDTAITNAPYVLPAEVADAINNNTTTINGSKITTGSITANQIAANSITGNNIAANVAISAPTINGGVINGGAINGVNITGAVIKASWIDYSSTGHLTNWAYFTPATMPTQYAANFAHNSTNGSLLVDNNGYVRLPKVSKVIVDAYLYKVGSYANVSNYGSFTYNGHDLNIRSYDSYATTSTNRLLNSNSRIIFDRAGFTLLGLRGGAGYNGRAIGTCSANWRIGTDVFTYYGLSQATNQGGDPHIYTTRLTKNGVALMDVTATVPSAPINSVLYNQTLTSSGMSVTIYAVGANLTVTIPNAINDLVGYSGIDTNISVGVCTGYASDGLSTGMLCDIPSGAEFY